MQLIEETVSPHLREPELSFYGNAKGSSRITSRCFSSRGEKPGSEALSGCSGKYHSLFQGTVVMGSLQVPWLICLLCFWDLRSHWAGWFLGPWGRNPVYSTTVLNSKARGDATPTSFLVFFAASSSSISQVLPCSFKCSFLSSGFAMGAVLD